MPIPAAAALPLVGGLFSAGSKMLANPKETARTMLQFGVVSFGVCWCIFGLNGRKIRKDIDEGKDRTFDASDFDFSGSVASNSPAGPAGTIGEVVKQTWPADLQETAAAVAMAESGGQAGIVNDYDSNWSRGTPSIGLFQIILPTAQSVDNGATEERLKDPIYNSQIAYSIYQNQGWGPWGAYTTGVYEQYMGTAMDVSIT